MNDLDPILARLGQSPVDARLDDLDTRVFARIEALRESRQRRVTLGGLALGALAIGLSSSLLPAGHKASGPSLAQISAPPPLAPSTLLASAVAG